MPASDRSQQNITTKYIFLSDSRIIIFFLDSHDEIGSITSELEL